MANPYRYMNATEQAMPPAARILLYNLGAYDVVSNRFGLGEGGQFYLLEAMLADMQSVGASAGTYASMVSGYLAGVNGWTQETGSLARLSATQFTVSGVDKTSVYKAGRALSAIQTASGYGYVSVSSYAGGLTTVTVTGVSLDAGLSQVWLGQDPTNAPKSGGNPVANQVFG